MSSGCGDVLSLEDMKTAKKHQMFEAEVITGRAGGVASGAEIDCATNGVTGQVQKTLPAILRDMGFDPAAFDFATGGTVTARDTVVYNPADNNWYSWTGVLPHVVASGTNPTTDSNWKPRPGQLLRQELGSSSGTSKLGTIYETSLEEALKHVYNNNTVFVENFNLNKTSQDDWSDVIESLILLYPNGNFIFGAGTGISRTIKYPTCTRFSGFSSDRKSVIRKLPGFVGDSFFEPVSKVKNSVQNCRFANLLLLDGTATADKITLADGSVINGRGTTSTTNGIDITGTFNTEVIGVAASYVRSIIYASEGDASVSQTTLRATLKDLDANQCNYVIDMPGRTSADNFCYGDIVVENIHCTGPVKYGLRILDTDGLQMRGILGFASFQVQVNGTKITSIDAHPFDPKAQISDAGHSAETLLIPARAGGGRSSEIQIYGLSSDHAGRLADTTSGSPAANNVGAYGIRAINADGLKIFGDVVDPSMGALYLDTCYDVTFDLNVRRVNTQDLGSGALPAGTYSSIVLRNCIDVKGHINDRSPNRNYLIDSSGSRSVMITGNARRGNVLGRVWNITDNMAYHNLNVSIENISGADTVYYFRKNGDPNFVPYTATLNAAAPSNCPPLNNIVIVLNNTLDTSVTDIPSVQTNQIVTVNIRDNGATKLRNTTGGGKFSGITDYTKGRGKVLQFFRDPDNGYLVLIGGA